ncbi:hypothetical protein [Bacillus sp. AFS053548]|uniref:hypothetical protein n=1 Tax=Bacillus sp. AFS053548 TaxID=2033505 RepID=UPI000BFEA0F1|nr:hypothetical protein [Bacillus sp. AFS053548]PGM58770.1 hypothetical protein CN946_03930 [Bacillus sp. AFS053548]
MKYKKIIATAVIISLFSVSGVYAYEKYQCNHKPVVKQTLYGNGKHATFDSVSEMESKSTLIVVGKKLHNEKPTILTDGIKGKDGYEGIMGGYTISDFQVKKILKNSSGVEINKNDIIPVLENAATDTIGDGKKEITYSVDGYTMMKKGKHYILFMDESSSDPGTFIPMGVVYGKAPLEAAPEDLEIGREEDKQVKKVISDAIGKYKKEMKNIE